MLILLVRFIPGFLRGIVRHLLAGIVERLRAFVRAGASSHVMPPAFF
jgi:hypothetical protein